MGDAVEEFKLPEGIKDPAAEFDLHESLGKGSFGSVFRATYKKTGNEVAIKEVIVNEDFMEILKEINIMKQCKSRYVVQYYGNYFKGDNCWIIMEYCAFGSVGDLLNIADHPLSEPQIAHICRSTLKGLSYLHRSNKIHRDIKPGNILVTGKGECKLADFGVSGTLSERTRKRNTVIGTPFFLAPEVIQEVGYDSKADIWALGITAIEMAEQNPPYYDVHPMRVLFLIPTNPPPTLKSPQNWSPDFSDFLKCCLDKDPARRSSAKQLLKHPFVGKAKSSVVMRPLIDEAQVVIDAAGGRLQALKEISNKKAQAINSKGGREQDDEEDEETESPNESSDSDSESESDSSDEDPTPKSAAHPKSPPTTSPTSTHAANNNASILELDSILSGIRSKSGSNPGSPQPPSRTLTATPPKAKATPEEELDALLSGLQAKAKVSAQSKSPASPSPARKPAATPATSSPRPSGSFASPAASPAQKSGSSSKLDSSERSLSISGNWDQFNCGGCSNSPDWRKNPQYLFRVTTPTITSAQVTLMQNFGVKQTLVPIGFYVVKAGKGNFQGRKALSLGKDYAVEYISEQTNFQMAKSVTATIKVEVGEYIVIPATFTPGLEASFELEVTGNPTQASSERLELSPLPIPASATWSESRVSLAWKGVSAGGSYSTVSTTWRDNPKIVLTTEKANSVTLVLSRGDSSSSIFCGFYLFKSADNITPTASLVPSNLVSKTTFLNGTEVVTTVELAAGRYIVLPCTYDANQESSFTLAAYGKHNVKLDHPDEHSVVLRGGWSVANGNAGGCLNHPSWRASPQYLINAKGPTRVHILLEQAGPDTTKLPFIGVYVLKHQNTDKPKPIFLLTPKDVMGNTEFMNDLQVVLTVELDGPNIILPSTFVPLAEGQFTLRISCQSSTELPSVTAVPSWHIAKTSGTWKGASAGGRYTSASASWKNNPRFLLTPKSPTGEKDPILFAAVLVQSEKPTPLGIGFYVFKQLPDGNLNNVLGKSGFVSGREVAMECTLPPGDSAIILPSTFEPDLEDKFLLIVYSTKECTLTPV